MIKKESYFTISTRWILFSALILCTLSLSAHHSGEETPTIIPQPQSVEMHDGKFTFDKNTTIVVQNKEQQFIAQNFANLFTHSAGFTPQVKRSGRGNILLQRDQNIKDEAYELDIRTGKIIIKASSNRGFFYALQSLRLLLPADIESSHLANRPWSIHAMTIKDEPRFAYRGFMLDVSRYFLPKEHLLKMIDCMAMLKLNTLHLHLTDDNGWRLEIKKYPKLTSVGAWRVDRQDKPFYSRTNQVAGETTPIGGFYTQEEMKEVVKYAAQQQIEVIPEIDIPAHSNAALAAYPEYACPVVKTPITVLPGIGGANSEIIFCAGNDNTYKFLQDVLDEVMEIFPSQYLHLGGDEASKTYWKKCPLCQKRIKEEKLANEEELQGYFMERMSKYVRSKGKQVMGWDELTNAKLPEDVIIFGWQGLGQAAFKAAEQGHRFVMTPARVAYLIRYQGPQWFEPLTYFGNNTLKDVFNYEPTGQRGWKPQFENLLMGVQASMWTEFCDKPEDVFYLVFPRLAALAEVAWVQKGKKEWNSFLHGLDNYVAHLNTLDVVSARSMYNIQHTIKPKDGALQVSLECIRPDVTIRYTVDGTEPSYQSTPYTQPIEVTNTITIKAATFRGLKQEGQTITLPISWNLATAKPVNVSAAPGRDYVLVNGLRGSLRYTDFEWYADLTGTNTITVDLEKETELSFCSIGTITVNNMGRTKPRRITLSLSNDGETFRHIATRTFTDEEIFQDDRFAEDISFELTGEKARYVRFEVEDAGKCPPSHYRAGHQTYLNFDEIIIK